GITTLLILPNSNILYPLAKILLIKVWLVYLGYKIRKNKVIAYINSLLKDITANPSNYKINKLIILKVLKEDKILILNITLVRLI
ncbi:hypothetical protein GE21DRAFT_1220187, partial [Neurospora crassa]